MSTEGDSTRDRIRDAARTEFAAVGFSGARVDSIARRAACNKQLIYHYFGDKAGLYEAVIAASLSEKPPTQATSLNDIADGLERIYDHHQKRMEWIRLLQWEALEPAGSTLSAEEQRRAHLHRACGEVEKAQLSGWMANHVDSRCLMVALMALMVFPFAFPQMVKLVTGLVPESAEFKTKYLGVVRTFLLSGGKKSNAAG